MECAKNGVSKDSLERNTEVYLTFMFLFINLVNSCIFSDMKNCSDLFFKLLKIELNNTFIRKYLGRCTGSPHAICEVSEQNIVCIAYRLVRVGC